MMVQSFTPEHPSITLAAKHDYRTFAAGELAVRNKHGYPPYQRMARVVMRGKDEAATRAFADRLAAAFGPASRTIPDSPAAGIRVIGPAEAPIFRLKNLYRFHFQLQSASSAALHQVLRQVLGSVRVPSGIELAVDIDPQDML